MKMNIKKLTLTAFLAAIAVAGSLFSFPVLGSRCSPIQHLVNVMCAVLLGPWYGLAAAFLAALIRNILGLGTLLAFPGSMCGALLSSLLYKWIKKLPAAYVGEVVGTGIAIVSIEPEQKKVHDYFSLVYLGDVNEDTKETFVSPNSGIFR